MYAQIVLYFLVYVPLYRIYSNSQAGTSFYCYNEDIDDMNETIELQHDIEGLEEIPSLPRDILEGLNRESEGSKPNIEETKVVNLANEGENEKPVKIRVNFPKDMKHKLIALLKEFREIFAWTYQDMPGLDIEIVMHRIPIKPECPLVQQALRRMKFEIILKIKEEVEKQLKDGFLTAIAYSDWVANIVRVPKKDGKVHTCVDYRDLNWANPKDNFLLPHIEALVNNIATNRFFAFMEGFSSYNQIKMAEEDKTKTAFTTHWLKELRCYLSTSHGDIVPQYDAQRN